MKTNKYIFVIITVLILGYFAKINFWQSAEIVNTEGFIATKKADSHYVADAKVKKSPKVIAFGHINALFDQLRPPEDDDLEQLWQEEYGCYDRNHTGNTSCQYTFLSAKSLKEAMWMKRNGYPSSDMINIAKDEANQGLLNELISANHPEALVVAAIIAKENGNNKKAMRLSGAAEIYAGKDKSYPYVLSGEAMIANDLLVIALDKYFIAALLGDSQAENMGVRLAPSKISMAQSMKSAYAYLLRNFGQDFPVDNRPVNIEEDLSI